MRLSHCFFAGVPTDHDWSQSYAHQSDRFFFGITVHVGTPIVNVSEKGKQILSAAIEAVPDLNRDSFLVFFKDWNTVGIDVAAVFVEGENVLLYAQGETTITLNRGGKEQDILTGSSASQFIEGKSSSDDYYTLATNAFKGRFDIPDILKSPQEACDIAVANLHKLSDSSGVTALFVKIAQEEKTVVSSVETPMASPIIVPPKPVVVASRSQFVLPEREKKLLRLMLAAFAAILVLLVLSGYLSGRKARELTKALEPYQQRYEKVLDLPTDKRLEKLSGLRELSRDLTDREKQTKEASLKRAYDQLLSKVNQSFSELSGEKKLEKLNIYYDFRLIAPDFIASAVAFDIPGKLAVFLDGNHSRLLSLFLEKKEALTLSVDDKLSKPFSLAVANRKAYVLGNEGAMELSLPLDKLGSIVAPRDKSWDTPKLIDAFGTNAYIFDSGARNILKIDLTDPGASPSGWLRNKGGIDFDLVTSMQVDGGLWLGDSNGKILRFMQGVPAPFAYKDLLDVPTSSVYLYTTTDSVSLYVLEPHAKRLLILNKEGVYQKSILSEDLATATGLIVDETTSKAYILSGSLVFEIGL